MSSDGIIIIIIIIIIIVSDTKQSFPFSYVHLERCYILYVLCCKLCVMVHLILKSSVRCKKWQPLTFPAGWVDLWQSLFIYLSPLINTSLISLSTLSQFSFTYLLSLGLWNLSLDSWVVIYSPSPLLMLLLSICNTYCCMHNNWISLHIFMHPHQDVIFYLSILDPKYSVWTFCLTYSRCYLTRHLYIVPSFIPTIALFWLLVAMIMWCVCGIVPTNHPSLRWD